MVQPPLGLVLALVVVSTAALLLVPDAPPPWTTGRRPRRTPPVPRRHLVAGAVALLPVVASWTARVVRALTRGSTAPTRSGTTCPRRRASCRRDGPPPIQFFDDGPVTAYFPMTSSLLHADGMALFGSDALTAIANLGARRGWRCWPPGASAPASGWRSRRGRRR